VRNDASPSTTAVIQALDLIRAKAQFKGETHKVYTRIAHHGGKVYLDLANEAHECVEIDAEDWRILSEPPVYFRRTAGMLPLPTPVRGGELDTLFGFINLPDANAHALLRGWVLSLLMPYGTRPVLNLTGEAGAAKTYSTKLLRGLIDPSTAPVRKTPKDDRDLAIAAQNAGVLAFDNLSSMPQWLSDGLCTIASGMGYSTRALYTDDGEVILNAKRSIVLNGIEEIVTRGDLL
jgi:hypothetical protein